MLKPIGMSLGTWLWQHNALFPAQDCGGDNTCDDVDDESMASLSRSNIALSCHVLCLGRSSQHCWESKPKLQTRNCLLNLGGWGLGMKWVSSDLARGGGAAEALRRGRGRRCPLRGRLRGGIFYLRGGRQTPCFSWSLFLGFESLSLSLYIYIYTHSYIYTHTVKYNPWGNSWIIIDIGPQDMSGASPALVHRVPVPAAPARALPARRLRVKVSSSRRCLRIAQA